MAVDDTLIAADRKARETALDVERSFIVQAPAGSGKTELLIQRYLTLLATVDEPEEVIAITFTRKATAEMRLRVVEALRRAERGERPELPHLQITADAASRVLARDRQLGWQLIRQPRRLRIQTLDALNGSIARMQPLTAAAGVAGGVVAVESEMDRLYADAAAATLDWLAEGGGYGSATRQVLMHIDNDTGTYVNYLTRMLRTRDQWLPFVGGEEMTDEESDRLRRHVESSLAGIVRARLERLVALVPGDLAAELPALAGYAVATLRTSGEPDHAVCELGIEPTMPTSDPDDLGRWRAVAEFLLTGQGTVRKTVTKAQGFPPKGDSGEKARMLELLASLADKTEFAAALQETRELPEPRYSDEQWSVLLALFTLLPVAAGELQRLCLARGITDYVDIAISAGRALGSAEAPGDIALLLDYQVRHILVDEMQDTSKAQYRMLESLTGGWQAGDGRTLFCVGDPMQSIYRFRNAEVAQFLLARDAGIGSVQLEALVLRRNFRSGDRLVHWFNRVFPVVLAPRDDPFSGAVSYSEAAPVEALAGQGSVEVHPVFGSDPDVEALTGLQVIQDLLAATRHETIAVLVRSRTQLPALLARLRSAGVAYQAVDIDRLTDLPEIIDCLALVRAATHPGDRVAWLGLLRSPWIGLSWADLQALVRNRRHDAVIECLRDDERVSQLSPGAQRVIAHALPVLENLLIGDGSASLQQRIERAWFELGGPALLNDAGEVDNVYLFFDTLAKLEVAGSIPDAARLMDMLDMERVSTSSAARVQVLTMHKSKGLQFDHVVLYGLGRHPAGNPKQLLTWFDLPDAHGGEDRVISPVGRRDSLDNDPLHQFIGRVEARKDANEQSRLLYVACTRARQTLHLVGHVATTRGGEAMGKPHAHSLLKLLWPVVEEDYEASFEPNTESADTSEGTLWLRPRLRRFDEPWLLPVTPPPPGPAPGGTASAANERIEYEWVGAEARIAGTVIHRCLELASESRLELDEAGISAILPIVSRWAEEQGAGGGVGDDIVSRTREALAGMAADARGRWILDGPGESELALSGIVDGQLQNVVIDRVRIDDDGTHWIVDYKTSSHLGGDLDHFIAEEIRRYTPQMARYAAVYAAYSNAPVRCALYFPLLGRFAEVSV